MAISVQDTSGASIRTYLQNFGESEINSMTLKDGSIASNSQISLVWEGSEYYLVEEQAEKEDGTPGDVIIRNLDSCLPITITRNPATE